jgi:hypothetical protein
MQSAIRRPRALGEDSHEPSGTYDLDRGRHGFTDGTGIVRGHGYDPSAGQDPAQQRLVDVLHLGQKHDPAVWDHERQQQRIQEGDVIGRYDRAALARDVLEAGDLGPEQQMQRGTQQHELQEQPEDRRTI